MNPATIIKTLTNSAALRADITGSSELSVGGGV